MTTLCLSTIHNKHSTIISTQHCRERSNTIKLHDVLKFTNHKKMLKEIFKIICMPKPEMLETSLSIGRILCSFTLSYTCYQKAFASLFLPTQYFDKKFVTCWNECTIANVRPNSRNFHCNDPSTIPNTVFVQLNTHYRK